MSNEQHPHQTPPINEEWLLLRDLIQKHSSTALTVILIIAVVAIGAWSVMQRQTQRKQEAGMLLASAQTTTQFEDILNRFPKSEAAPIALLSLAKLHYDMGRYSDALTQYETFLEKWADHSLAPTATLGRLFAREAIGTPEQIQQAKEGFRTFAETNPGHYLYPQARLGEARCKQNLGMLEEARSVYQHFLATYPESPWEMQIEERLMDLERKIRRQQSS
ncbi:MAG: tetratricopeptide repeat protein [Kiritimatiellia bacterium]